MVNRRDWFLHNYLSYLVNNYDKICIEDLNISGMMKNHKLAGSIVDVSWRKFVNMLEYKCRWYGKESVKVNRYYRSYKTCSVCEFKNENLELKDRYWTCSNCGTFLDRDLNTSINILKYGHQSPGNLTDVEVDVVKPMKCLEFQCL